mgnify:CR=1 FL=1
MIDQKPRDPLYPQGFEDIDNLKNRQIPRPKPKENEDNDLKILKSFNQKLGKYIGDMLFQLFAVRNQKI